MRRQILIVVAVLLMASLVIPARAESMDMTDRYALQYLQAVEAGQSEFTATVPTNDFGELLRQAFTRYPVLFYYYDGYSGVTGQTFSTIEMKLKSVSTPWQSIYVVDSKETLKAVVGLGLTQLRQQISFVTVGGFSVADGQIGDLVDEIMAESYLTYMGYYGNAYNYGTWDEVRLQRYDLTLRYWDGVSLSDLAQWRAETEKAAIHLASTLFAQDMPDYQKELLIHDWLVENNRYNTKDTSAPASHMAYSALVTGDPVCQGYSEAMFLLAQAAGIPCLYVPGTGTSGGKEESHSWNCMKIDGQWYMLDITWDDPVTSDNSDLLRYDYFNVTSRQLAKDHQWDQSAFPECTATAMDEKRVRQLCENSTATYTQYSAEWLVTLAEAEDGFEQRLQNAAPQVPHESPAETQPTQTESSEPTGHTGTTGTRPVQTNPPVQTQPKESGNGGLWIVIAVVLLAAGGGAVGFFLYAQKQKEAQRRRRRREFNPMDPFDGRDYDY